MSISIFRPYWFERKESERERTRGREKVETNLGRKNKKENYRENEKMKKSRK